MEVKLMLETGDAPTVVVEIDSKAVVEILLPLIELAIIPKIGVIMRGRQPLTKNLLQV